MLSISDQERLEKVILPTEFQNLPDFHTYLKIANCGITRMKTARHFLPLFTDEFLPRHFGLKQMLKEESSELPTRASVSQTTIAE